MMAAAAAFILRDGSYNVMAWTYNAKTWHKFLEELCPDRYPPLLPSSLTVTVVTVYITCIRMVCNGAPEGIGRRACHRGHNMHICLYSYLWNHQDQNWFSFTLNLEKKIYTPPYWPFFFFGLLPQTIFFLRFSGRFELENVVLEVKRFLSLRPLWFFFS